MFSDMLNSRGIVVNKIVCLSCSFCKQFAAGGSSLYRILPQTNSRCCNDVQLLQDWSLLITCQGTVRTCQCDEHTGELHQVLHLRFDCTVSNLWLHFLLLTTHLLDC